MMLFIKKLHRFGIRRAFVLFFVFMTQRLRVYAHRLMFSDNKPRLSAVRLNQPAQFVGKGQIAMKGVNVGAWPSPGFLSSYAYFEARHDSASIQVGEGTSFNNGAAIVADKGNVFIGKRCLIGPNFFCTDSDFHGLDFRVRKKGAYVCKDVVVCDDVFIGSNVTILKGVTVGRGAVIGAGSVVVENVPELAVCAGSPAKIIKQLK